jgi:hypothetical protein
MANGAVRTNLAEFQGSVTKEDDSLRGNATAQAQRQVKAVNTEAIAPPAPKSKPGRKP